MDKDFRGYVVNGYLFRCMRGFKYPQFDKVSIARVWEEMWWSFLHNLSKALYKADLENEMKIRATFSNYIENYIKYIEVEEQKSIWKENYDLIINYEPNK